MAAFSFAGPKWDTMPITWSIAKTTYSEDKARPFSSFITDDGAHLVIAQAFARWAMVSGLPIQEVTDAPTGARSASIRVGYGDLDLSVTRQIGETSSMHYDNRFVPNVIIRLDDPTDSPLDMVAGHLSYRGSGGATLYQVALHEIGHALGLAHSRDPASNLFEVTTDKNRDLGKTDVEGIRALYPANVPKSEEVVPQQSTLRGSHADYEITLVSGGQVYIADSVAGRDGTRIVSSAAPIAFGDGVALLDPSGAAGDVTRLYRGAFGRTPDLRGLEDNTALLTSKTLGLSELAASFVTSPEFNERYGQTDAAGFVRQLYRNILQREPDAAGEAQWMRAVNATSRSEVLRLFADSQENHVLTRPSTGDRDDATAIRIYQAAFGRLPDGPGLAATADALSNGVSIDLVAQSFVTSGEFGRAYGPLGDEGLVTQLYQNVLHRAPDAAGKSDWLAKLSGGATRGQVLAGFSESNENRIATAGLTHDGWVFVA